jgi:hypothetical protein
MARRVIGYRFIKNRWTGRRVGPLTPVFKEDWPYEVPGGNQRIWRYIDFWKFEHMLQSSSLYFRRADKLSDTGEGRLSAEGVRGTSASERAFRAGYKIAQQGHAIDVNAHEATRSCMFINCWNIDDAENGRMWVEYTTGPESVAISTTFARLIQSSPIDKLIISRVKYIDDKTPRDEFFHTTAFFYKDKRFSFENELRLVRPVLGNECVMVDDEKDFGKLVSIAVAGLIERIVANKHMPESVLDRVRQMVSKHCPSAQLSRSDVEPQILYVSNAAG